MDDLADLRCGGCGSTRLTHFQTAGGEWRNRCAGCGLESEYMPTLAEIRRACVRIRCENVHLRIDDDEERFWRRAGAWNGAAGDDEDPADEGDRLHDHAEPPAACRRPRGAVGHRNGKHQDGDR